MGESSAVAWRRMTQPDLVGVESIGDAIHPDYPEDATIIAERLQMYGANGIQGYAVAHPWLFGQPPPLNKLLGQLPVQADTLYIHDLALTPKGRNGGFGTEAVDLLARQARREAFMSMSLVAVGSSPHFWRRNGFEATDPEATRTALATYKGSVFMKRELS